MSSYQIIKLKNGEDLICNVLDNDNGRLKVTTPLKMETVNRISKKGLTESDLKDYLFSDKKTIH